MECASTYWNSADTESPWKRHCSPASLIFMGFEEISLEMKREPFLLDNCVVVTAKRRNQLICSISLWVAPAQICTKGGPRPATAGQGCWHHTGHFQLGTSSCSIWSGRLKEQTCRGRWETQLLFQRSTVHSKATICLVLQQALGDTFRSQSMGNFVPSSTRARRVYQKSWESAPCQ